jgi:hypothetical protein
MLKRFTKILVVLIGAGIFLWAGVEWSQSKSSRGGLEFDQGWLLIAVALSQFTISRFASEKLSKQKWQRIIPMAAVGFVLEGLSDRLFIRLRDEPSRDHVIAFAVFACLFLVYLVTWIVVYPYEGFFVPVLSEEKQSRQRLSRAVGALVAVIIISGALRCFHVGGAPNSSTIGALQAWLYKSSLLVHIFLALRIFSPMFVTRLS